MNMHPAMKADAYGTAYKPYTTKYFCYLALPCSNANGTGNL